MAEVDLVIGNTEKMRPETWTGLATDFIGETEKVQVDDIMSVTETAGHLIDGFGTRSRAYVQVQNGCDHRCTFCIIPFGRGNSRSVPAGVVVDQIKRLVDRGYNEVVLTGVDLTSWGGDLPGTPRLGDLVMRILRLVPDLPRLRISSIDSIEADENLMLAIATEPRLMPHLHLSLQHGHDLILKRMKRRHLRDDAIAFCRGGAPPAPRHDLRRRHHRGLPHRDGGAFRRLAPAGGGVRPDLAPRLPLLAPARHAGGEDAAVDGATIKDRARRLRDAGERAVERHLSAQVGRSHAVLMENPRMGRTAQFAEVIFDTDQPEGRIVEAHVTDPTGRAAAGAARLSTTISAASVISTLPRTPSGPGTWEKISQSTNNAQTAPCSPAAQASPPGPAPAPRQGRRG
jgi:threonylcarbamoyladenosine tRNA methylthiotransferase MtaB